MRHKKTSVRKEQPDSEMKADCRSAHQHQNADHGQEKNDAKNHQNETNLLLVRRWMALVWHAFNLGGFGKTASENNGWFRP
jgi:ATP adenylyltransferase/5',5'''-P-1,P-4-tetraphosphate phosphorylase II